MSHAGFFHRFGSSDLNLSRRVERSVNLASRADAAFVVGGRGRGSGTGGSANRSTDNGCLGALAEDLSGDGADRCATGDFLNVLALRLVLDPVHLRVAGRGAHWISVSAKADGDDTEAHHHVVIGVLAALQLRHFDGG